MPICARCAATKSLLDSSPLKNNLVDGIDMIIVRELTGGLYYGTPRGITGDGAEDAGASIPWPTRAPKSSASPAWPSNWPASAARKVTSVDKSNVLEEFAALAPRGHRNRARLSRCRARSLLVDNCAMQLVLNPKRFDVVLTENMFGDILSDEGAVLAGSIGMLPSASIGDQRALRRMGRACMSRYTAPRPISRARTRPIRSAPSARWPPCSNTVSDLNGRSRRGRTAPWKRSSNSRPRYGGPAALRRAGHHRTGRRQYAPQSAERGTYQVPRSVIIETATRFIYANHIEKIWDSHVVHERPALPRCSIIDLHLVHEVTSPQAFSGLRERGLKVRRPDLTIATVDHSIPTTDRSLPIVDPDRRQTGRPARGQLRRVRHPLLRRASATIRASSTSSDPNWALTQPGMTVVCGDSHTATHGAFGALAFGIGTSEVETCWPRSACCSARRKPSSVRVDGTPETPAFGARTSFSR